MPKLLRLAALAAAAFAAPVWAQELPSHIYAGAAAGRSHWDPGCPGGNCSNTAPMGRVFGGYQFNGTFAAEAAFTNLGIIENETSRLKAHAWEAAGIAAWPPDTAFSLYGKLGMYYAKIEGSGALSCCKETSNGATAGGGFAYTLTRNIDLRGEAQHYWNVGGGTLPKSGINTFTAGALWRFR
ncbi:MAG TPA: outer membrane beta-barrel protein [Burkholderiales bacterium]|nr:outer membrane beta-barrel protein [Burkholderiales bacterium]